MVKKIRVLCVIIFLVFTFESFCENIAIVFTKSNIQNKNEVVPWDFGKYGIKVYYLNKKNLKEFKDVILQAKIFIIDRGTGGEMEILFKKFRKLMISFLEKGGILFFQYGAGLWVSDMKNFFTGIDVKVPEKVQGKYYKVSLSEDNKSHPLLNTPNSLPPVSKLPCAYGWWSSWSQKQKALFVCAENKRNAAMIIQEDVLGKGKVIFSRIFYLTAEKYLRREKLYKEFIENLFTYAFGALKKGESLELNKKENLKIKKTNLLYFRNLINKPWLLNSWNFRIPVLVKETTGFERYKAPVSISIIFPEYVKPSSIRVITPWGEEIPSQVRVINKRKNKLEIFFLIDLLSYEYFPLFIYFDNKEKPLPSYSSDLRLIENDRYFILSNSNIFVKIRKDRPFLVEIRKDGNLEGNQFYDECGFSPEGYGMRLYRFKGNFSQGKVIENGPLRKTIEYLVEYKGKKIAFRFSLISKSKKINYSIQSDSPINIQKRIGWLPGKALDPENPDQLYFMGKNTFRRLRIKSTGMLVKNLIPEIGEGWYAFEDMETGEIVGEIFDLQSISKMEVFIHGYRGFMVTFSHYISSSPFKSALFCLNNRKGIFSVRRQYLYFKTPPEIYISEIQTRNQVPSVWKRPALGKNFMRSYHQFYGWYLGKDVYPDKPYVVIPYLLSHLKKMGANWISLWAYRPFWKSKFVKGPRTKFLSYLVREAHNIGMGVEVGTPTLERTGYWGDKLPSDWNADLVKFGKYFVDAARELGNYDIDLYLLRDEDTYVIKSKEAKKLFRKIYNMDPPDKIKLNKLNLPAYHNKVLFQMDIYTKTLRDMAEAVRNKNKKVFIGDQVNVSSMTNIKNGAPHDWERHSDFLTTLSMDLYGKPRITYKYYIKLMRATFNGLYPVLLYSGCTTKKEYIRPNQNYGLMWGIDGLIFFSPGYCYEKVLEEVKKNYYFLDYTGIGDMIAQYYPVKYVGLFRDRSAFIDSIKKGRWSTRGSLYDVKIQNFVMLKNFQTDIIFSKYFNFETLKYYPVLIIVDESVFSDKYAKVIEKYVKNGGNVVLEGEVLRNNIIQNLIGVHWKGKSKGRVKINTNFLYEGDIISVENYNAKVLLNSQEGKPVFFERKIGDGKIYYTPLILSEKILYDEAIASFIKRFIEKITPPFLKIRDNSVDTNLLTNGKNYILGIYNSVYEDKKVKIEFSPDISAEVVVDFASGKFQPFKREIYFVVPKNEIRFFFLGERKDINLPNIKYVNQKNTCLYSNFPYKDLLAFTFVGKIDKVRRRAFKKKKEIGITYVGILSDKGKEDKNYRARVRGDEGIYKALQGRDKLRVEYICDLNEDTIFNYDVIVIPNIGWRKLPPVMKSGWERILRKYVMDGGNCILCHHAIGFCPCEYPPFPEIGEPAGSFVVKGRDIVIIKNHPITTGESLRRRFPRLSKDPAFEAQFEETKFNIGDTFKSSYPDYIPIKPGNKGIVVCTDKEKRPVVVAGRIGKGKVILCGIALGAKSNSEEGMNKGEENILINSIYWLGEK